MLRKVTESKRFLDGHVETFECEVLALSRDSCVLRYVSDREFRVWGLVIPTGTVTYAFYWRGRGHTLWRLVGPHGVVIGHKFDVCDQVEIAQDGVGWRDLLLDVWVDAAGRARVLDEAEFQRATSSGALAPALAERTQATCDALLREHPTLIAEAERELARLGVHAGGSS